MPETAPLMGPWNNRDDSAIPVDYFTFMILFRKWAASLLSCVFLMTAAPATAGGNPEILGTFGGWTGSRLMEGGQPVCYMTLKVTPPPAVKTKTTAKTKTKRGEIFLMITHRPADNSTDVVSYTAGMKFKPASEAIVTVGPKKFNLFTQGDTAWSRDSATDHELAAAVRNGATLNVTGESAGGALIADTVDLKGSFAAYAAISKACGLAVPSMPKKAPAGKAGKDRKKTSVKKKARP